MRKVERIFRRVCKKYAVENRRFTKEDFYRICKGENIQLINSPEDREFKEKFTVLGLYFRLRTSGDTFIYLKSFFGKKFDRMVAFHELGHHFCGHLIGLKSKENVIVEEREKEAEADHFAFLATGLQRRRKSK